MSPRHSPRITAMTRPHHSSAAPASTMGPAQHEGSGDRMGRSSQGQGRRGYAGRNHGPPPMEEANDVPWTQGRCRYTGLAAGTLPGGTQASVALPHLHLHTQAVEEMSREGQAVHRRERGINPAWGHREVASPSWRPRLLPACPGTPVQAGQTARCTSRLAQSQELPAQGPAAWHPRRPHMGVGGQAGLSQPWESWAGPPSSLEVNSATWGHPPGGGRGLSGRTPNT